VEDLPLTDESPPLTIVTVLAAGDDTKIEMARSLLDAAGIGYWVKGERLQDFFGVDRLGPGYNVAIGPILLQVDAQDAEEAFAVLDPGAAE
jgi:Putative prokaryotic signal transducing protein